MEYFISFFLLIFEFISLYNLSSAFFKEKEKPAFQINFFAFFALTLAYQMCITADMNFPLPKMFCHFLLNFLTIYLSFSGNWKSKTIVNVFFLILLYAVDYAVSYILVLSGTSSQKILANPIIFICVSFSSRFISILITFFTKKIVLSKKMYIYVSFYQWVQFFIYSVSSLLTLYLIIAYAFSINSTSFILIMYTIAVVISNITLLSVMGKLDEDSIIRQQNILLNQKIKDAAKNINALSQAYSEQRSMSHEFNNHMSMISSFLENNKYDDAKSYAQSISKKAITRSRLFYSSNPVVDTLLAQKYSRAKVDNILFLSYVDDLSDLPMRQEDIAVVLSNLLDNAIEACAKCSDKKIIKVKIKSEKPGYILSVHNTTQQNIIKINDEIVTRKEDRFKHGYGIKNIKSILNKYGYDYAIRCKNGWFSFSILMQP